MIMKTIKTKLTKKLHILFTGIFATTLSVSSVQAIELVEVETINHIAIMTDAKMDLGLTLQIMPLKLNSTQDTAQALLAKQIETVDNKGLITLVKTTIISE